MITSKKIFGFAAATFVAASLAAGAANAGIAAPSLDALPKAETLNVSYPGGYFRRCASYGYRFRRVLPRRIIFRRLVRQGFYRIRGLRYRPGRVRFVGGSWRRMGGVYKAIASRRYAGPYRRYRVRINACTGRVVSVRRIGWGRYGGYGY